LRQNNKAWRVYYMDNMSGETIENEDEERFQSTKEQIQIQIGWMDGTTALAKRRG